MTTTRGRAEHHVTAFLDNDDSPDITNPIHSTDVARQFGYRAALVGGVTVYGWAVPAIVEAVGERWLDDGWIDVSFRHPVYPGDELTIVVEPAQGDACALRMTKPGEPPEGGDAVRGTLGLGRAAWFGELRSPAVRDAGPRPASPPPLTLADAPIGADLLPMAVPATAEAMRTYAVESQHSDDPRFVGEAPLLHPGWIAAQMTPLIRHNFDHGLAIHTRSHIQHLARAESAQTVTVAGVVIEAYERKGHHYVVLDGAVRAANGRDLARIRHTTIFRVAQRGR